MTINSLLYFLRHYFDTYPNHEVQMTDPLTRSLVNYIITLISSKESHPFSFPIKQVASLIGDVTQTTITCPQIQADTDTLNEDRTKPNIGKQ